MIQKLIISFIIGLIGLVIAVYIISTNTLLSGLETKIILQNANNYNSILANIILFGGGSLLALSIYHYFKTDTSKYLWLSVLVIVLSILVETYLIEKVFVFKRDNGFLVGFSITPFYAAFKSGVVCIIAFIFWAIKKFYSNVIQ